MTERRTYRLFVLLFGLWFALAPAVYAAPITTMAAQSSMSDDTGPGGCDGCPDGNKAPNLCKVMCMNFGQLAISMEPVDFADRWEERANPVRISALQGSPPVPDPAPPKNISLL